MAYTLSPLPYSYDALEPFVDEETMHIHHDKHHQAYCDKTNAALEGTDLAEKTIEEVLSDLNSIPEDIRTAVRNNGGGYANHNFFFDGMSPEGGEPDGDLITAMDDAFGSLDDFKKEFSDAALTQFGSGWAWLVADGGSLLVIKTSNQDSPLSEGKTPLLNIDVWEHAYYLKYQNKRPEWIEAFWNLVNWEQVTKRFNKYIGD